MPVILGETSEDTWLTSSDMPMIKELLKPYDASRMEAVQVSKRVNSTQNDDRSLTGEFHEETLF
jgi:putative SOS response-associated peptidase YedK